MVVRTLITQDKTRLKCGFADLVSFTEEILNGKLYFLCSDRMMC